MAKNHLMAYLREGLNSVGYYTKEAPETLVIFVHGFFGDAVTNWSEFERSVGNKIDFIKCDFIFYGYDSLSVQVTGNGHILYDHLQKFVKPPQKIIRTRRPIAESYNKIILLAHSLGAIVVRRALLSAKYDEAPWLNLCSMILFAPAHCGVHPQKMALELLPNIISIVAIVAPFIFPVLNDIQKNAQTIADLKTESEKYLSNGEGNFAIASIILEAPGDRVVYLGRFGRDPNPKTQQGRKHKNVCKPSLKQQYSEPIKALIEILKHHESGNK